MSRTSTPVCPRFLIHALVSAALLTIFAGSMTPASAQGSGPGDRPLALELPRLGPDGLPEGMVLIDGDIQVPKEALEDAATWLAAKATFSTSVWPDGVVPFEWDPNLTIGQQLLVSDAFATLSATANLFFRIKTVTDVAWVHIRDSGGDENPTNSAPVGWGLGFRTLNIADWQTDVILHELLHVLGFWHEQSRTDRDASVRIESDNILAGTEHNFNLEAFSEDYGPYDFGSLMHYTACAFSVCEIDCAPDDPTCRTITVLPPNDVEWQDQIGFGVTLSRLDALSLSFLYPQDGWRFVDVSGDNLVELGTFFDPWKSVSVGIQNTPSGGTLWVEPGSYAGPMVMTGNLTLRAPQGGVVISN